MKYIYFCINRVRIADSHAKNFFIKVSLIGLASKSVKNVSINKKRVCHDSLIMKRGSGLHDVENVIPPHLKPRRKMEVLRGELRCEVLG